MYDTLEQNASTWRQIVLCFPRPPLDMFLIATKPLDHLRYITRHPGQTFWTSQTQPHYTSKHRLMTGSQLKPGGQWQCDSGVRCACDRIDKTERCDWMCSYEIFSTVSNGNVNYSIHIYFVDISQHTNLTFVFGYEVMRQTINWSMTGTFECSQNSGPMLVNVVLISLVLNTISCTTPL